MDCAFDDAAFDDAAFDVCITPPATHGGTLPRYAKRIYVAPPVGDWRDKVRRKREEEEIIIL